MTLEQVVMVRPEVVRTMSVRTLERLADRLDTLCWRTVGSQSELWSAAEDALAVVEDEAAARGLDL